MLTLNTAVLERYMRDAGITTRADLAHAMGVHRSTVARLLDGKTSVGTTAYSGLRRAFPGRSIDALVTPAA